MQQRIKKLKQNIVLLKLTSVFIICTFLLSIAPPQLLHNILVHHKEIPVNKISDELQFSTAGYNCDCSFNEATSPFDEVKLKPLLLKCLLFNSYAEPVDKSAIPNAYLYCELRGPPSLI